MTQLHLPWGDGDLTVKLPTHWRAVQTASPALRPAPADWPDRMARALSQPDTGPPLSKLLAARPGARVVLIVEDLTRHSPLEQILPIVLRELAHARVPDERIEIVFATGMHPALSSEQAREKLGPLADRFAWRSNPWPDASAYRRVGRVGSVEVAVNRGVLAADLRVIVSSVSPHLQAGFGGGGKMLLPGCASLETIRGLHRLGVGRHSRQLVGTTAGINPMRAGIDTATGLVDAHHGRTFAVQYLLDGANRPCFVGAGDPVATQRMLAKQCSVACGVVLPELADVVITDAAPRDFDLWQSFKGIANTLWAARPGGVVICCSTCREGLGEMTPPNWPLSPSWTRRLVRWLGPNTLAATLMRLVPSLAGDAAFVVQMGLQMLHRNPILMVSPTLAEAGRFPGLPVYAQPDAAVAAAEEILGTGPQRVVVFPAGGITFPIPAAPTARAASPGPADAGAPPEPTAQSKAG